METTEKKKKQRSVAFKVTMRVSLILLCGLAVLLLGSFLLVHHTVTEEHESSSRDIVSMFYGLAEGDMREAMIDSIYASEGSTELDPLMISIIIDRGSYICDWYHADYAYAYIPDPETDSIYCVALVANQKIAEKQEKIFRTGDTVAYDLTKEELAVWNGDQLFGSLIVRNPFNYGQTTLIRLEDRSGNAMLIGVDMNYTEIYGQILATFSVLAGLIVLVTVAIGITVFYVIRRHVSHPAKRLSERMQDFLLNGQKPSSPLQKESWNASEYTAMTDAFNQMTDNIRTYVQDINELTRTQAQQQAELSIAAGIQLGFLPPSRAEAPDYVLNATMLPAKDVGGDLYDYLRLDDHRLLTVVADVSGKGVSAAIFMAVTLVLIHQYARMDLSPSEILQKANDSLAESNPALLFATAFVGIYDAETRTYTYANAGHNAPYVIGEKLRRLDAAPGTPLGLFAEETYPEKSEPLYLGDTVFLYTDGVNEATNASREFFGDARLEEALERCRACHAEDPIAFLNNELHAFVGGAEQHDDVTMLTLKPKDTLHMELLPDVREFPKIRDAILLLPMPRQQQLELCVAAEECFVNICSYAFEGRSADGERVAVDLSVSDRILLRFTDGGQPFNPLEHVADPETYDMDAQTGGLGNLIAVSSTDDVKYEYQNGKNVLTFTKYY